MAKVKSNEEKKALDGDEDNLLTCADPKLLLTTSKIYLFYIVSKQDIQDQFSEMLDRRNKQESTGAVDLAKERIDLMENKGEIEVRDVQVYDLMDFEFIQKQ